mgnify:CR=1 FL=1
MNHDVYSMVKSFKKRYPLTISWRLKKHCKIVEDFLNPDEEVRYAFAAQKNNNPLDIVTTYVVVLTNKRILLGTKRLLFGYFYTSITPDLFNDLKVSMGIVWGKIIIDTIKERVFLTNIERDALDEIETNISQYMLQEKQKFVKENH